MHFTIREIQPADDTIIAEIIRNTLKEFGVNKPGTVFYDSATDHLSALFKKEKSKYFIAEYQNQIAGGGGIYPTDGLPPNTCELVKMYLLPHARG
ncbi:MAG: GNAT family N-acetyltransferase, partial [Chitinophagales bacterium]